MTPTIHLNGTSREELLGQLCDAIVAINAAVRATEAACPNARDYYPLGPDAIKQALAEHTARIHKLQSVNRELNEIAEAI